MNLNNVDWGFIMDTAIAAVFAALVTVGGTILINWFGNRKGYKDINNKIGNVDNTTLSGQHSKITEDIQKTLSDNSKELNNKIDNKIGILYNTTLSGQNQDIIKKVESISEFLEKEKNEKLRKNDLLGYDVQKINSSIESLSGFAELMKDLFTENSTLKFENHKLTELNKELIKKNNRLEKQLEKYYTYKHNDDINHGMTFK